LPEPFASLERGVTEEVRQVALGGEGYARMLSGWLLVDREEVPLAERAEYAWRYALFLEGVKAFEPGWEAKAAWRKAAFLLQKAQDPRAFSAWQKLLPEEEAVAALLSLGEGERLWEALFQGRAYEALLQVLPLGVRPDLRAQALFRLGRYGEALPFYREWARRDPRGYLGLGYALWRLGRRAASPSGEHLEEALEALARYDHPESRYAQGRILEEMGRILEAVEAYRAAADGRPIATEEDREVRIDLPVDAHIPVDYVDSDRLRLEAYRKFAAADSAEEIGGVVDELVDRYGPLPEEVARLVSVAKLRMLARELGVKEVGVAGSQIKISPLELVDSQQVRLKRIYPSVVYRATTGVVGLPIPRTGGIGSDRVRDVELVQVVADLLLVVDGRTPGSVNMRAAVPAVAGTAGGT
jgi:tetratricopeptide (TPR) repeat protein